jgi:hypothetical protein
MQDERGNGRKKFLKIYNKTKQNKKNKKKKQKKRDERREKKEKEIVKFTNLQSNL